METFVKILDGIIYIALALAFIEVYLKVNKIWKRKQEEQVAQSQSLIGLSLSLLVLLVWTVKYIIIGEFTSIIDNGIYILETTVMMIIGTGIFVKGNKRKGLKTLIKQALRIEKKEATHLIKAITGQKEAIEILDILNQLAWIDNELDVNELIMIKDFAKAWNIDYSEDSEYMTHIPEGFHDKLTSLRKSMIKYIDTNPDRKQIAHLTDLLKNLISADNVVSEEEEIIFEELNAIIKNYLDIYSDIPEYHVLIVPQNPEQIDMITSLRPNATEVRTSGGTAFSLEKYYSKKYAEQMCNEYRNRGLFTIIKML